MVVSLDSQQPVFILPPLSDIPDDDDDKPKAGLIPVASVDCVSSYGIRAFDTSAYYGPSEIVLGTALKTLELEFPRSTYQLMTKCGRYGTTKAHFDYRPDTIRRSVQRSLERLHTDYLDTVYLHDVEFVCTPVQPRLDGNHTHALDIEGAEYGLSPGQENKVWGEGDQIFLNAVAELRKMKAEGLIKNVGITGKGRSVHFTFTAISRPWPGYPLPTLLRLAILVANTAPYEPLDVLLSYSHLNLQNASFAAFVPAFRARAHVTQLVTASPLNMGLLTPTPPSWSPAPSTLRSAVSEANNALVREQGTLVNIALGFAYRRAEEMDLPTVIGLSRPSEVHDTMRVWRALQLEEIEAKTARLSDEEAVRKTLGDFVEYSWASPAAETTVP
ncbi:hypothetical protein EIP86_003134 [Pleurotus ostreatoroseus]|nr:hypothetical protein EIP86_003134 [Pleurotus ostreatoroseus]